MTPLWPSLRRSLGSVPSPSSEARGLAVYCFLGDCRRCDEYRASAARAAFEARLRAEHGVTHVLEWRCDVGQPVRRVAERAGVRAVPAYVLLSTGQVLSPP